MLRASGFLVGVLFGFVLERGYFCHFSGFFDMVVLKRYRIARATIWALLISLIGFHLMAQYKIIALNPKPLLLFADLFGGVIFGLGMFMISACMAGATFKFGTGSLSYLLAMAGIGAGAYITKEGFLKSISESMQGVLKLEIGGKSPTLANVLDLNVWIPVVILAGVLIWLLIKLKNKDDAQEESVEKSPFWKKIFTERWNPAVIGIAMGITEMLAFYYLSAYNDATKLGKKYAISLTEGYALIPKSLVNWDFSPKIVTWAYLLIIGIIVGSAVAAIIAREFKIKLPKPKHFIIMPVGGLLMGIGASIAGGCNVGHLLSGVPQLSIGSILASLSIFGTLYLMMYVKFIKSSS